MIKTCDNCYYADECASSDICPHIIPSYDEIRNGQEFYGNGYKKGYSDAKENIIATIYEKYMSCDMEIHNDTAKEIIKLIS